MTFRCRAALLTAVTAAALLLIPAFPAGAQTWSKTFHHVGGYALYPNSVIRAGDGGFYLSVNQAILKLDPFGNTVWSRGLYSSSQSDLKLLETSDGSVVAAGFLPRAPLHNTMTVLKLDANGVVLWDKDIVGNSGRAWGVVEAPDGSLLIAGHGFVDGTTDQDLWLIKMDQTGNVLWQKRYGGSGIEGSYWNRPTLGLLPNGNIVLVGDTHYGWGGNDWDLWVLFLDVQGDILSQNVYGGTGSEIPSSLAVTSAGNVLVAAATSSYTASGFWPMWLLTFNSSGDLIDQTAYGAGADFGGVVEEMANGDIALRGANNADLLRLSASGSVLWANRYTMSGWTGQAYYSLMEVTEDQGFLIGSIGYPTATGISGGWLLRTDAAGGVATSCSVSVSPIQPAAVVTDAVAIPTDAVAVTTSLTVIDNLPGAHPTWYYELPIVTEDQCGQGVPRIEAVPWRLDFGLVGTAQTATMPIEIRNTGELDLWVAAMDVPPPFGIVTTCAGTTVPTGGACVAAIEFNPPSEGPFSGELTVDSDDPATPVLVVPVTGEGTNLIFEDAFESGDSSAWSAAVP